MLQSVCRLVWQVQGIMQKEKKTFLLMCWIFIVFLCLQFCCFKNVLILYMDIFFMSLQNKMNLHAVTFDLLFLGE